MLDYIDRQFQSKPFKELPEEKRKVRGVTVTTSI